MQIKPLKDTAEPVTRYVSNLEASNLHDIKKAPDWGFQV